ncbi:MAG: glycosyltransferase [Nitrospirae bacterium]|nr:glycosyltransferase [Nitrospirota bacterium]
MTYRTNKKIPILQNQIMLSIVLQGRNDDYMGNFVWRLSTNINKQAKDIFSLGYENQAEIILTDWGSKVPLKNVLMLNNEAKSLLRIIEVLPEIANKYNLDSPYSCVHAINTGIRRSLGEYILFCDGDTYIPTDSMEKIFNLLNKGNLNGTPLDKLLLLASRYHIPKTFQQKEPEIEEIDDYIEKNKNILAHDKINLDNFMGTATAYLMSRNLWFECRGFDENLIYWGWFDIDIFYRIITKYPVFDFEDFKIPFFHLEHYSDSKNRSLEKENPRKANPMIYPSSFFSNSEKWGLFSEKLSEAYLFPIIFIHKGDSDYLTYTLRCAKLFNPQAEIILLGDETNEHFKSHGIKHYYYSEYEGEESHLFDSIFKYIAGKDHPGKPWWVHFVFKRWFHIYYFTKKHNISRFWTFDSDTMILTDLSKQAFKFIKFDCTEQCNGSCMNGLIGNSVIVKGYIDQIINLFQDEEFLLKQQKEFEIKTKYAFTEMRAYEIFRQKEGIQTIRLNSIINDETFDDCICQQHEMEIEGGVKKLYFINNGIYLKHIPTQKLIKANSLNMSWVPVSFIKQVYDIVSEKKQIPSQQSSEKIFTQKYNDLPIHFFTIVLNGEPFIRHHIEVFKQLPFKWHWHIIEGVADLKYDTAWSLKYGARITDEIHKNGLSNDGTTEYLDTLIREYSENITIYRKEGGNFWDGKLEMVNAPLKNINEECLLWQIDADELWTVEQICTARTLFINNPEKTAAYYYCHYFVGEKLVIASRNTYGNHTDYEWLRTWRYIPGDCWMAHEPPKLYRKIHNEQWIDIASINIFKHNETEEHGLVFQHYSYAIEEQLFFKERYFGYSGAVNKWKLLQLQTHFPTLLRHFFNWVEDNALVDTVEALNIKPLALKEVDGKWHFRQHELTEQKTASDKTRLQIQKTEKKRFKSGQNILWIRTDAIGDAVLSASMLPFIREKYPEANITVVCQKHLAEIYEPSPFIDRTIVFDKKLLFDDKNYLKAILREIQDINADIAFNSVYSPEPVTDILTIGSVAKEKIGLEGDLSNIPADFREKSIKQYTKLIKSEGIFKNELERHRDFLKGIDINSTDLKPVIWLTEEDEKYADNFFKIRNIVPEKTIILSSCAQFIIKYYQHYGIALSKICKENDFTVVAVGADHERERNQYNLNMIGARTINLCGQTTIGQTAALVKRSRLSVGADSAINHIACAVGTPNVVVLGGGHFGRFFPYSPLTTVICRPMQCYQCNWSCKFPRPYCIQNISSMSLSEAIRETLNGISDRPRIFFETEAIKDIFQGKDYWKWFGEYIKFMSADLIPIEKSSESMEKTTAASGKIETGISSKINENAILNGGFIATTFKAGLCNRIFEWTIMREISEKYCMTILVDWEEVKDGSIILPDTKYFDLSTASSDIANTFIPIRTDLPYINSLDDLKIEKNKNYILVCDWNYKRSLTDEKKRINEIQISKKYSEKINDFLKKYGEQIIIGIHVRKGDYIPSDKFLLSDDGKLYRLPDWWYIHISKQILNQMPDAKFFLATDATEEEKEIFKKNLPIISISADKDTPRLDILELFTLSRLPAIICSISTFSIFARDYGREKVSIWPEKSVQDISNEIEKLKSISPLLPFETSCTISLPRFSVVTPSYNQGQYIEKTILSVLEQEYPDFEHIIIDGGSTDNTLDILKKYPHLKWLSEKDEGQSDALNKGFRMADGDIIAWINSDDWYEPEAFVSVAEWFSKNPDKNIVMGDCNLIDQNGKIFYTAENYERGFEEMSRFWITGSIPTQPAIFFRRKLLDEYGYLDKSLKYAMDYDLWIRFSKNNRFYHIEKIVANYLFHENSKGGIRQDWNKFLPDCKKVFKKHVLSQRPPEVSVVIACYNQAVFLPEAVESVINQIYQDFEIIIVNDGSTDDTQQTAEMLAKKYPDNIIKIINQKNMGVSSARNAGIKASMGKYILPLDADDMLHPDMLLRTTGLLDTHPEIGIAYTDVQKFGKLEEYWQSWDWDLNRLYFQNILPYCSLYRREVWEAAGGYKERIIFGYEDWDFWISCAEKGIYGKRIPENLLIYRTKETSRDTEAIKSHDKLFAHIVLNHPSLYKSDTIAWAKALTGFPEDSSLLKYEKATSTTIGEYIKPMNILLCVHSFPTQRMAGTELYVYHLARELINKGHKIKVLYPVYENNSEYINIKEDSFEDITLAQMYLKPCSNIIEHFKNEKASNAFNNYISSDPPDIVHFHHFLGISVSPLKVCYELNIPSVVTLHDEWILCEQLHYLLPDGTFCSGPETIQKCIECFIVRHPEFRLTDIKENIFEAFALRRLYFIDAMKWINTLIVPSLFLKNELIKHEFLHPNILHMPLGLHTFTPVTHKPSSNSIRLTYLGNINFTKGFDVLIKAFNLINSDKAELNVYGKVQDEIFFHEVMSLNMKPFHIKIYGQYNPSELPEILSKTDLAVIPSRSENYPFVVRECLHAGVPVIASNVGGIPEIIKNGENGLLFESGNFHDLAAKLTLVIMNPKMLMNFRKNIKPVKSIAEDVIELEKLYREILENKKLKNKKT